jgi:hypothetical protein
MRPCPPLRPAAPCRLPIVHSQPHPSQLVPSGPGGTRRQAAHGAGCGQIVTVRNVDANIEHEISAAVVTPATPSAMINASAVPSTSRRSGALALQSCGNSAPLARAESVSAADSVSVRRVGPQLAHRFPARATGTHAGRSLEPQFVMNIALAALAADRAALFPPCDG